MPTSSAGHVKHSQAMPALLSDDRTESLLELEICLSNESVIWLGGDPSHLAFDSQNTASYASANR